MIRKRLRDDYSLAVRMLSEFDNPTSEDELQSLQLANISRIWADAVNDIPYYNNLVRDNNAPKEIRNWNDFHSVPILSRKVLQDNQQSFRRKSGIAGKSYSTGGSTGEPITIGITPGEERLLRAAKLMTWIKSGYSVGDRILLIWGHSHLLGTGFKRHVNHAIRRIKDKICRYTRFDAYVLNKEKSKQIIDFVCEHRPVGIIGYACALDYIARTSLDLGHTAGQNTHGFVMPCAEPLPKEDSREILKKAFGRTLCQEFGGVDFGHVAFQTGEEPFRVINKLNCLEIEQADSSNSRDSGPSLITSLYDRYFPLIRYQQGDEINNAKRNSIGLVYAFDEIKGRVNDTIRTPTGDVIHSVALAHCIKDESQVSLIQLIVDDANWCLNLVAPDGLSESAIKRIRFRLSQLNEFVASAKIEVVDDAEVSLAGKRRWLVDNRKL